MQCKNSSGNWGNGPICKETGKEITFLYGKYVKYINNILKGIDMVIYCGWDIENIEVYNYLKKLINLDGKKIFY